MGLVAPVTRSPALVRNCHDDSVPVDNAIDQVERKALQRNCAMQRVPAPPNSGKLAQKPASSLNIVQELDPEPRYSIFQIRRRRRPFLPGPREESSTSSLRELRPEVRRIPDRRASSEPSRRPIRDFGAEFLRAKPVRRQHLGGHPVPQEGLANKRSFSASGRARISCSISDTARAIAGPPVADPPSIPLTLE